MGCGASQGGGEADTASAGLDGRRGPVASVCRKWGGYEGCGSAREEEGAAAKR